MKMILMMTVASVVFVAYNNATPSEVDCPTVAKRAPMSMIVKGDDIHLSGGVDDDADDRLAKLLVDFDSSKGSIGIISNGGYGYVARNMGRMLKDADATIIVLGDCYSACATILAGGTTRVVSPMGTVGIHKGWWSGCDQPHSDEVLNAAYINMMYLDEVGLDAIGIAAILEATASADIYELSNQELMTLGYVTEPQDSGMYYSIVPVARPN